MRELLNTLIRQRALLDGAIQNLQLYGQLNDSTGFPQKSRRGRKSMNEKERLEVSLRMKKYWAGRRKQLSARQQG